MRINRGRSRRIEYTCLHCPLAAPTSRGKAGHGETDRRVAAGCGAADEDVGPTAVWHSQMTCCGGRVGLLHLRGPPLVRRLVLLV